MVGYMLMVDFGIMVSQSMFLLAERVADANERIVDSKLIEWLRFGTASWRGAKVGLLLECNSLTASCLRKMLGDLSA
jgi:hypothetical protein